MSSRQRLLLLSLLLPLLSSLHPPLPQLLRNLEMCMPELRMLELRMLELPLSVQSTSFCFSVADTGFFCLARDAVQATTNKNRN